MLMLDTNTVSYFWRNQPSVVEKMRLHLDEVCISAVTAAELHYGVAKRKNAKLNEFLSVFFANVPVMAWDKNAALQYGNLRSDMEQTGKVMSLGDQMIAAHALALGFTVISNDKTFLAVPNLTVQSWWQSENQ